MELLLARWTMALSLGFHIVFASVGIAMPFFMAVSHYLYLTRRDKRDLELTKMWSRGVAIFFATGAVSGTVLSFELGLLWPAFMRVAGGVIGMPFAWEGTAFFVEAIALGLFLYGWGRLKPWTHWGTGVVVGLAGLASGVFVLSANGWMNAPRGFTWQGGKVGAIDPVAAMFNDGWRHEAVHMLLAAFEAVGFAVAGVHAWLLLRGKNRALNRRAVAIALAFGAAAAIVQPLTGDRAAKWVARHQPEKFAAMEGLERSGPRAPFRFGGVEVPGLLSFLAFGSSDAEVKGLDAVAADRRPPVFLPHAAFQLMVGLGTLLALVGLVYAGLLWRGRELPRWFLRGLVWTTPAGVLALEAGWVVTEVGRQPWILYGVMRTSDAVTPAPGVWFHAATFVLLYLGLTAAVAWILGRQIRAANP